MRFWRQAALTAAILAAPTFGGAEDEAIAGADDEPATACAALIAKAANEDLSVEESNRLMACYVSPPGDGGWDGFQARQAPGDFTRDQIELHLRQTPWNGING